MMITVPKNFATTLMRITGDAGRSWLDNLPAQIMSLCHEWQLTVDGAPMHGGLSLVVPVKRGDERCALKLAWPNGSTAHEALALSTWNGQGAVRLLAAQPSRGALLLERLGGHQTLSTIGLDAAIAVAAELLQRLAIPAPAGFPLLRDVAPQLAQNFPTRWEQQGHPFPRRLLDIACDVATRLGPFAGDRMVNYDLHYDNVLAGAREAWLVIDPKVVVGDPEYGIAQLLWRRFEVQDGRDAFFRRLELLIELAALDPQRAQGWTIVRCVDYWLWGLSVGLTEDPARCAAITTWLTGV